jgi:hypothetical protein
LAKQLHPDNPRSVPAAEKQIRRLVQDRDRRRFDELRRRAGAAAAFLFALDLLDLNGQHLRSQTLLDSRFFVEVRLYYSNRRPRRPLIPFSTPVCCARASEYKSKAAREYRPRLTHTAPQ